MTKEELKNNIFIGVIEDNNDPQKLGRCKVRVMNVFEELPVEDLPWAKPWKDLGGNIFTVPEKGKVVSVVFDMGSIYKPEFIYAEHYNVNLEAKLNSLSDDDYPTFKSVLFDQSTQIYRTKSGGLFLDHEYTNVNLDEVGNINLNLKNNGAFLKLGTEAADQSAVLGNHFMDWMDTLIDTLSGTPYMGNMKAPVFPSPTLLPVLAEYRSSRATSKFLSKNVFIVDNGEISTQTRDYVDQDGDKWRSTVEVNRLVATRPTVPNKEPDRSEPAPQVISRVDSGPIAPTGPQGVTSSEVEQKSDIKKSGLAINKKIPNDFKRRTVNREGDKKGAGSVEFSLKGQVNGEIDYEKIFKISERLKSDIPKGADTKDRDPSHCWYLYPPMAKGWDDLMAAHDKAVYPGKAPYITSTDGYRTVLRQIEVAGGVYSKYAAQPVKGKDGKIRGTSPHGMGIAVDVSWGILVSNSVAGKKWMGPIFRHPTYQWFRNNAYKYGIYNPVWARDLGGREEWWHWEYHPEFGKQYPSDMVEEYAGPFTKADYELLKDMKGCKVKYMDNYFNTNPFILLYDKKGNYLYDNAGKFIGQGLFDAKGNYIDKSASEIKKEQMAANKAAGKKK